MDLYWDAQWCKTCTFVPEWNLKGKLVGLLRDKEIHDNRCYGNCRKNPPNRFGYPEVYLDTPACSHWEEA